MLAFDRALAFDRSLRTITEDGHLHVARSNISKATVNPYFGSEIPDFERLGLDPKKKYWLWRHPDELKRAATSFNGKPILADHVPVTAAKHRHDLTVGALGTDATYKHPYLQNSLHIWAQPAIDAIDSGEQKELSAAYHYDADMRPGVTPEGVPYDGIMRNIRGNHIALVADGRAGADVIVADALPPGFSKEERMPATRLSPTAQYARGALTAYLRPRLAQDAAIDYSKLVSGLTAQNFSARRGMVHRAIIAETKGKLAQDADLEDLGNLIDALKGGISDEPMVDQMPPGAAPPPARASRDAEPHDTLAMIKRYLEEEGVAPEIIQNLDAFLAEPEETPPETATPPNGDADIPMVPPATAATDESDEEDEEEKRRREAEDEIVPSEQKEQLVTKAAMDRAIKIAQDRAIKNQRSIRDAERFVRPWVGELAMDASTPADVYRATLRVLGVKGHETMHADALRPVLEAQPRPAQAAQQRLRAQTIAQDAKSVGSFAERFPDAGKVTVQ